MHSQRTILPLQKWTGYEANQPFQYELRIGGKSPRLSETWNQKEKKKQQQQNFFSRVYLPFNAGIKLVGAELPSCWSSREKQVPICTLVWGMLKTAMGIPIPVDLSNSQPPSPFSSLHFHAEDVIWEIFLHVRSCPTQLYLCSFSHTLLLRCWTIPQRNQKCPFSAQLL